jgi:hypothetical protein
MFQITKKKKQNDTMSNSGANEDELMKQLNGLIKSGNVTQESIQALIESAVKKKKSSSSSSMASSKPSSKVPSVLSAIQELKSLSKMDVESQLQDELEEEDS